MTRQISLSDFLIAGGDRSDLQLGFSVGVGRVVVVGNGSGASIGGGA